MTKATGVRQIEFLSKYAAPLFMNLDLRPAIRNAYSFFSGSYSAHDQAELLEERILTEVNSLIGNPNQDAEAEKKDTIRQLLDQYNRTIERKNMEPVYKGLMRVFEVKEVA